MEKYRIISRWTSDYRPRGYRQDGQPQERVESLNLFSEAEAKHALEYFNKHLTDGAWIADRYEIDDDKYRCFELILPEQNTIVKVEDISLDVKTESIPIEVVATEDKESEDLNAEESPKKKRNKIQRIEIFEPVKPIETIKLEEISSPTKIIIVVKYLNTQKNLGPEVRKINGRLTPDERMQIYSDFNNNFVEKMSITEAVVRLGGIRYDANGKEIEVEFLDDIDHHTREFILSKIYRKF